MTETVVHVETIEQWKSVLDVWFAQGYEWLFSGQDYREDYYDDGSRQIGLNAQGDNEISFWSGNDYFSNNLLEYEDFMAKQEKKMTKETYYVTREQLETIERANRMSYPLTAIYGNLKEEFHKIEFYSRSLQMSVLRYLGGDDTIEFKVKETLYRLWRIDDVGDKVYMKFGIAGTPTYTPYENEAFTATEEEIEEWQTPAWEIEEAD